MNLLECTFEDIEGKSLDELKSEFFVQEGGFLHTIERVIAVGDYFNIFLSPSDLYKDGMMLVYYIPTNQLIKVLT